jgi:zinc protease
MVTLGIVFGSGAARGDYEKVAEKTLFNNEKIQEFKLKNGFRVLLLPRHQAKVLTYQVWFNVGSNDEKLDPKLGKTGLAHLFEHMMFRETEKHGDGQFNRITSSLGVDRQNASTDSYRTNYFENIPSNHLERLMELESDRMKGLKLSKMLLEREKGAVVGEYRLHMDRPINVALDELQRLVFTVSPFRWTVLGTEDEIRGFSLDEAKYFYKTYYAPNNATLIVIGDTTEEELMKLVQKYYGPMPSQEIPKITRPPEPPQTKERKSDITHPQASSDVLLMAYRIPDVLSSDIIPLSLLGAHLSTGTEARLYKLLVDTGIAVRASASPGSDPDLFEFIVQMAEGYPAEKALAILDKEILSVQKKRISKESFERALNQELLSLYGGISDNVSLGNYLGEYLMMSNNYLRGFEIIQGYKQLTPTDLERVAKQYFKKESRSIVIVRPEKKGKS